MKYSPDFLPQTLYESSAIWQMKFLNSQKFATFARDRDIDISIRNKLKPLWQVGLLKADYILSPEELQIEGLSKLGTNHDGLHNLITNSPQHWYSDDRDVSFPNGLSDTLHNLQELPRDVIPYFHPFRYYILLHLQRILEPSISPIQELLWSPGTTKKIDQWQKAFRERTSSQQFLNDLNFLEEVTRLCIATEPCTYTKLFSKIRHSVLINENIQRTLKQDHCAKLTLHYKSVGIESIEKIRQKLCIEAETLDSNKDLHGILRLTRGEMRIERVKCKIGGAMLLLSMAEMLRRFSEQTFDTELPEENELGFGYFPKGVKEKLYDTERLFDGNQPNANTFLRQWGLDYGIRLRWYVEGDTELGALEWIFGGNHSIDLINLLGQVAERGGRGVAFRENLLNDIRSQIFSLVTIDSDVKDNVRVVRRAAEDDEICGGFFVSKPDFEMMNFTLTELREILWKTALENGVKEDQKEVYDLATKNAKSFDELLKSAKASFPDLNRVSKGKEWGARLMQYAWENQSMQHDGEEKNRPIIDAVLVAFRARNADYLHTRRDWAVDLHTGKLVPRGNADRS